jgi:Tol biopolymer transport system component
MVNGTAFSFPRWSPDSLKIVFESGWSNIYTMNKDGTELQFVTNGTQPIWLPYGENLIFLRNGQIYRRNLVTEDEQPVSVVGGINYIDYWTSRTN